MFKKQITRLILLALSCILSVYAAANNLKPLLLDGKHLTIENTIEVARGNRPVEIDLAAMKRANFS